MTISDEFLKGCGMVAIWWCIGVMGVRIARMVDREICNPAPAQSILAVSGPVVFVGAVAAAVIISDRPSFTYCEDKQQGGPK